MPNYYTDPNKQNRPEQGQRSPSRNNRIHEPEYRSSRNRRNENRPRNQYNQDQSTQPQRRGNFRLDQNRNQKQPDLSNRKFNTAQNKNAQGNAGGNYRVNMSSKAPSEPTWYQRRLRSQANKKPGQLPKGKNQLFATYLALFLLMGIFIWIAMPTDRANTIVTRGNNRVPRSEIVAQTGIVPMDKKSQIEEDEVEIINQILEQDPLIEDLEFDYSDWRGLNIDVTESVVVGKTEIEGATFGVLSNGAIVPTGTAENIEGMPWLVDFSDEALSSLGTNMYQVEPEILNLMDTIYYSTNPDKPHVIEVQMKDGSIVKASLSTFAEKIKYYPQMVEQTNGRLGIYNLEVGAYFTPQGEGSESIKLDTNLDN
ncbi:hypothetical protein HZY88_08905 [Aerococcaceae bacterium DSM 111176]|nr:hypothetical protein [Aerococcaceae bacterium DSM 111176]